MATKKPVTESDPSVVTLDAPEHEPTTIEEFIEHQRKAFTEAGKALLAIVPKHFQSHSEAAIKESIEGYRTLVNNTLDDIIDALQKAKLEKHDK